MATVNKMKAQDNIRLLISADGAIQASALLDEDTGMDHSNTDGGVICLNTPEND